MLHQKYFWINLLPLALCVVCVTSCGRPPDGECSQFEAMSRRHISVIEVEKWVDEQYKQGNLAKEKSIKSPRILPGQYAVPIDDRRLAAILPKGSQARVINGDGGEAAAVFFGARGFEGLIVELPEKHQWKVPKSNLKAITARTSLVCIPR
ncbi:MAG TPA: hypothetical protein VLC71_08270 [Thermomonas sp.]|nr:hypothetical protein [Thermomonas sp.]